MSLFRRKFLWTALGIGGLAMTVFSTVAISACASSSYYSDGWTMPVVNHVNNTDQKYYSWFYDPNDESNDPGSAQSRFVSVHDGDTFSLSSERAEDFASVAGLLANALDVERFTVSASTRLFAVDTPEVSYNDGTGFVPTTGLEKLWADRATEFVKKQMGYGTYAHKPLITINGKETYSRNVANIKYVPNDMVGTIDDGEPNKQLAWNDLGADLVRYGLARVAYTDSKFTEPDIARGMPGVNALNAAYIDYLIALQDKAIAERVGLWSADKSNWWNTGGSGRNPNNAIFPKAYGINRANGLK